VIDRLRIAAAFGLLFLLQISLFAEVHPLGVAPELPLLFAIYAGRESGSDRGVTIAFLGGLLYDVVLNTPLGLWAVTCAAVAYGVGGFVENLASESGVVWWATTAMLSGAGVVAFALLGALVGREDLVRHGLLGIAIRVAIVNTLLSPGVGRVVRWGFRSGELRPV
jgi:rod shape-determining protein MreD